MRLISIKDEDLAKLVDLATKYEATKSLTTASDIAKLIVEVLF